MLQLFTLGELRLLADDGTLLSRRGKPLLLLTYLARHAPSQVTRTELAALLWGERDESRARHSLRQSLLELGKLVGDRLVVDPESVRLDTTDLEIDVDRFEGDIAAGRDREAVARWAGDFLRSADASAEMSLQLWIDTERAGLRRLLTLAFERLLESAERRASTREAIAIARQWTELAPLDEHACERLIAALRRAGGGHAAEALAAHSQFTTRVREALDTEPSREFVRLAQLLDDDARADIPERGRSSLPSLVTLPFVGRATAHARVADAWQRVDAGSPAVVVVSAAHGLGATRLCDEVIQAAQRKNRSTLVLRAHTGGSAPASARAYSTVNAMLQNIASADALGGISPEMLAALSWSVPSLRTRFPHLPPASEPEAAVLATAVGDAIEAAAEDAPVLVVVDTLSDADAESRALLLALTRAVRGAVLVVLVLRATDADDELLDQLRGTISNLSTSVLHPLTVDDIAEMLHDVAPMGTEDRASLAQAIHTDTAGTPLYATALIQSLFDERLLSPIGEHSGASTLGRIKGRALPVPVRVRSDARQRLRSLDVIAQQAADAAAVLDATFTASDVAQITGMALEDAERALVSLEQEGFLAAAQSGARPPIQPPVVARAVYALIPPLRRESLHAAAANLSGDTPWYRPKRGSRASYHRARAGGGPQHRVWTPWVLGAATVVIAASATAFWFGSRPAPSRDPTVAVFPFVVTGGPSVQYLHAGMVDLLSTSLDGIGSFRTVDPRSVIAATTPKLVTGALEPDEARRIASRLGATYFVLGSVVGVGGQLEISAALFAVKGGTSLARAAANGSDAALFGLVDRVTAQLAVAQGAHSGERLAELAAVTTSSLDALKAYLEGRSAYRANDLVAALTAFQRAVEADTSFALAWYGLGTTASWMLRSGLEQRAAAEAVRESGRLSARDRMLVQAFAAYTHGEADSTERLATSIVETYDDVEGWVLLGEVLYHHNWKRGRSLTESRRAWERVLALDPTYWPALQHLSEVAAIEGRDAEADSLLGRYESSVGTQHMLLPSRAMRAYAYGDADSRASLARSLAADRGFFLIASVWYVAVFAHDIPRSHALASMLVEPLRPPKQQGFGHVLLAHLDLAQGKWHEARAELAIARVLTPLDAMEHRLLLSMAPFLSTPPEELRRQRIVLLDSTPDKPVQTTMPWPQPHSAVHPLLRAYLSGMIGARVGDDGIRNAAVASLERLPDSTGTMALGQGFAMSIHAEALRQKHRTDEALTTLERGARQTPFVPAWTSGFVSQAYERFVRAELLHELGRDDESLRWYATFGENSPYDLVYLAPSLYRQGLIHQARGATALAKQRFAQFIAMWKDCDPELRPMVNDAQARLAKLKELQP